MSRIQANLRALRLDRPEAMPAAWTYNGHEISEILKSRSRVYSDPDVKRPFDQYAASDRSTASTLGALALVALVPVVCVIWFMSVAIRNERLAVRQQLTELYQNHLTTAQREITAFWKERQQSFATLSGDSPSEKFAATIRSNWADSAVLYDSAGRVSYPQTVSAHSGVPNPEPSEWTAAREVEFQKTNYLAAAEAYSRIAQTATNVHWKARALQSRASCLIKADKDEEAIAALTELIGESNLSAAANDQGALIVPNAQLLLLKLLKTREKPALGSTGYQPTGVELRLLKPTPTRNPSQRYLKFPSMVRIGSPEKVQHFFNNFAALHSNLTLTQKAFAPTGLGLGLRLGVRKPWIELPPNSTPVGYEPVPPANLPAGAGKLPAPPVFQTTLENGMRWSASLPSLAMIYSATLSNLVNRLNDYRDPNLASGQRRFLMEELQRLDPESASFPTLAAEQLAAEYLERNPAPAAESKLSPAALQGVWRFASANPPMTALFRESRLRVELGRVLDELSLPELNLTLSRPGENAAPSEHLLSREAGEFLPGWRLDLGFKSGDPFEAASRRQTRFYLWSGSFVIALVVLLAVVVARFVSAQIRLARLKDELVSTVSHELKTPVASTRVLIDTLLAGRYHGPDQLDHYLSLVAKENHRLSHLIDNFLSFSRMERNKPKFEMADVDVARIVDDAVSALQERLDGPDCRLEIQIAPDLPKVRGDREALTTVLINLLENAWKYTGDEKRIFVKGFSQNGSVVLAVRDNGIGLEPVQARRVFDRFYQADQSLTRKSTGCGLGLSIVLFIVKGHGGSVEVASEPGKGSTFTVRLPAAASG